jgi:hypothetical protein
VLADYVKAGVIAILFGAGGEATFTPGTTNYDAAKDGITNPAPINGNTLEALYPDDDGGYLRLRAKEYYSGGPVKLP